MKQREDSSYNQFKLEQSYYLEKLDFLNWYRFFFITQELLKRKPQRVLEIGEGSGFVRRVVKPVVDCYETMDVNEKLTPTYQNDVRELEPELQGQFDCVIAADILEHLSFNDLELALNNLRSYLKDGGVALITIPHRAWFVFWLSWLQGYRMHLWRFPDWVRTLYQRFRGRSTNPIDPDHQWEIGDGLHSVQDVERVMKTADFTIESRTALLYVDFWILRK